jgi:hypothetical protein
MTMQVFTMSSNMEWDAAPDYLYTDPDHYNDIREKTMKALAECNAHTMEFYWYGMPQGSGFMKVAENGEEPDAMDDDAPLIYANDQEDYDVTWEGPHLKVSVYGSVTLVWNAKHSGDECWCDIRS